MMKLPIKSTVVSVGDKVVLISPVPGLKKFQKQVETFGKPTDIVAPNSFHHMGIEEALEMYPNAKLWGIPALEKKRSDISWTHILPQDWPYSGQLDVYHLKGMPKIDEMVFFHRDSKTLIVSDLFFNHVHGKGIGNWIIFNMFGTYKKFAVSKFFAKFIKDKNEFRSSIDQILSLDIERIIVPHGVNITKDAKARLEKALKERELI